MSNASLTTLQSIFKTQYIDKLMQDIILDKENRPLTSLLQDAGAIEYNAYGRGVAFPIVYERPSTSATFTTAQSVVSPALNVEANPSTLGNIFSPFQIEKDALYRAKGDKAAFMSMAELAVKQHTAAVADSLESALFGTGDGVIGHVNGAVASGGTTLTLDAGYVPQFRVGDELVFCATKTGTVKSGSVTVTAIAGGYDGTTLTIDDAVAIDSGSGIADNDYVFRKGDIAASTSALKLVTGLDAYATDNTSLHGFDNTAHPRLQFLAVTGGTADPLSAIKSAQTKLMQNALAGKASVCLVPWSIWLTISEQLDGQDRTRPGGEGVSGYNALKVVGPNGAVSVVGSRYVPANTMFLIDPKVFKLFHVTPKLIELEKDDKGAALRDRDASDVVEGRISARAQLICTVPGANAKITLS